MKSRTALRAWLLAAPVFLVCSAIPTGGLGRERGYVDVDLYGTYAEGLLDGRLPYRDVFVEYPPGAFVVLVPPALVTDDHYRSAFKILMAVVALGGLWCVARLLVALGASRLRLALGLGFVAFSPLLLGSVWLNSYDAWPAALTAAALLALVTGFGVTGFACLGVAFAAKVYAIVLVVPAAIYVAARWGRRRLVSCAAAFVAATVVTAGPFVAASPDGAWSSIRSQIERGLHVESLGASVLLAADRLGLYEATVTSGSTAAKSRDVAGPAADALAFAGSALVVASVVAVWLAFWRPRPDPQRLAVAFAAGVAAVLAFGKVLSPQYAEWLLFLVPLAAGAPGVAAAALAGTAFLLAELWFHHYDRVFAVEDTVWLVLLRNLALVACYGVLLSGLLRRDTVSQ
ncbi:MAG: glycosyltransferase 87 family protein [Gaiellaceae bacterium]